MIVISLKKIFQEKYGGLWGYNRSSRRWFCHTDGNRYIEKRVSMYADEGDLGDFYLCYGDNSQPVELVSTYLPNLPSPRKREVGMSNYSTFNVCLTCGRLIMKPGVVYGYAGPVCHCIVYPKIQNDGSFENEFFNERTPFGQACDEIKELKSQLAILREALEHICEGCKHNRVSPGLYRLASDALKKCFGEREK